MKKLSLIFLLLIAAITVKAQVDFGVKANLISRTLSIDENISNITEGDAEFGYQFGVFLRLNIPILPIYVQPEALVSNVTNTVTQNSETIDLSFNQIDVPVMLGTKIGPLRVVAGPAFRFMTKVESTDAMGVVEDIKENYSSSTVGYQVGAGIDFIKFLTLDLRYEGSFSDITDEDAIGGFDTDQRINQWVIGVGFKIF